jgi:hypothetical protein
MNSRITDIEIESCRSLLADKWPGPRRRTEQRLAGIILLGEVDRLRALVRSALELCEKADRDSAGPSWIRDEIQKLDV